MIPLSIDEVAAVTGGQPCHMDACKAQAVTNVVIDSRLVTEGALYVPVHGDRFDGHQFIPDAFSRGAVLTLSERETDYPSLLVDDCVRALQALAHAYRNKFDIPVVGLTGSVGKTTTKELVRAVLAQRYTVLATKGNLNNQTGVPQVLFELDPKQQAAVIEMGTNHFGEIDRLSAMVEPTVCLITCIGTAHIEFFGDRRGILRGKTELLAHRRKGAPVLVNGDDDLLATLPDTFTFGLAPTNDLYADELRQEGIYGVSFTAHYGTRSFRVRVPAAGEYMVYNALAAIAVGLTLGLTDEELIRGVAAFVPPAGRMTVHSTKRFTLIDGAYNANPTSMEAALRLLSRAEGRRVCIFGDMLELGAEAPRFHRQVGELAKQLGIERLLCVGALAASALVYEGAEGFCDRDALHRALPALLRDGDVILVKASQGMHLDKTVRYLETL